MFVLIWCSSQPDNRKAREKRQREKETKIRKLVFFRCDTTFAQNFDGKKNSSNSNFNTMPPAAAFKPLKPTLFSVGLSNKAAQVREKGRGEQQGLPRGRNCNGIIPITNRKNYSNEKENSTSSTKPLPKPTRSPTGQIPHL